MKSFVRMAVLASGVAACPAVWADVCTQLPASLQNVSVSQISQAAELQKLDEQLEASLRPCFQPVNAGNRKSVCANGRVLAEQVLMVVSRIDEAGKKNALLSNAKMKSYKTGAALLEHMKKLSADKICV